MGPEQATDLSKGDNTTGSATREKVDNKQSPKLQHQSQSPRRQRVDPKQKLKAPPQDSPHSEMHREYSTEQKQRREEERHQDLPRSELGVGEEDGASGGEEQEENSSRHKTQDILKEIDELMGGVEAMISEVNFEAADNIDGDNVDDSNMAVPRPEQRDVSESLQTKTLLDVEEKEKRETSVRTDLSLVQDANNVRTDVVEVVVPQSDSQHSFVADGLDSDRDRELSISISPPPAFSGRDNVEPSMNFKEDLPVTAPTRYGGFADEDNLADVRVTILGIKGTLTQSVLCQKCRYTDPNVLFLLYSN